MGRFLQTDPIGYEDDLNLYAYVRNDPLNNADPSGRVNLRKWLERLADAGDIVQAGAEGAAAHQDMLQSLADPALTEVQKIGAVFDYMGADPATFNGPPLVIGQTQERVVAYAEHIGGETVNIPEGMNPIEGSVAAVESAMSEGRQVIDTERTLICPRMNRAPVEPTKRSWKQFGTIPAIGATQIRRMSPRKCENLERDELPVQRIPTTKDGVDPGDDAMPVNEPIATLAEIRAFAASQVDKKMKRIGFELIDRQEHGGLALRRTYRSPKEPFVIDFYAEGGDSQSATGLLVRTEATPPARATHLWKFREPPPASKVLGITSARMVRERFESDFALLLKILPEIRERYAER